MPEWLTWVAAVLMLFPVSETVIAVVNRLISESAKPKHLARLALTGRGSTHGVMVAVPAMLTDPASNRRLVHRLHLHFLANPERNAQFALLTDWADADTAHTAGDGALMSDAIQLIRELNLRHPAATDTEGDVPRFLLLHRDRQFSETEQRWIGWERKRGKLEQLIAALAQGSLGEFLDLGGASRIAVDTRYVLTLDS